MLIFTTDVVVVYCAYDTMNYTRRFAKYSHVNNHKSVVKFIHKDDF